MMRKINLWHILLASFVVRIILAPLAEHGDVINYYWWAKDIYENGLLGFYERHIPNAMPPTYPPVTSYFFYLSAAFQGLLWKVFWFLNISIKAFPSNLVFWLESERGWYFVNKLPAIFADLGIVYVVYLLVKKIKTAKNAKIAALLFGLLPPFWYSSAVWGQTDSIFALFMLMAFYLLFEGKMVFSGIFYLLSFLTKPTSFFALPIFALYWLKKGKFKSLAVTAILALGLIFILYFPFHPSGTLPWVVEFYQNSLGGELDYIVANAFNFWGLVHGFGNVSETASFLGLPSHFVGYATYSALLVYWIYVFLKTRKVSPSFLLLLSALISFSAFLFLPRMHERYFYPVLLLLLPLVSLDKKTRNVFYLVSFIHVVNLYHFWWVPRIDFLVELLSNRLVEGFLILLNFYAFYLLFDIQKSYTKSKS